MIHFWCSHKHTHSNTHTHTHPSRPSLTLTTRSLPLSTMSLSLPLPLAHLFAFTNKRRWTPPHDFFQGIFLPQNAIAPRNTLFSLVLPVPPVNCPPLPFCSGSFWFTLTALLCRKDPSEEEDQKKNAKKKKNGAPRNRSPAGTKDGRINTAHSSRCP